jgi:hypothetical protein
LGGLRQEFFLLDFGSSALLDAFELLLRRVSGRLGDFYDLIQG